MANFRDITFDGRSLNSFGLFLKKETPIINFTNRELTAKRVLGAINGDEVDASNSFDNIEKVYNLKTIPTKIPYDEDKFIKVLTDWIYSHCNGKYYKLYDSKRKGCFYKAYLSNVGELKKSFEKCFEISLTFSAKPFLYTDAGQEELTATATAGNNPTLTLENPEIYASYPQITIHRNGNSTDGGVLKITDYSNPSVGLQKSITIDEMPTSLTSGDLIIDSEIKNVYSGTHAFNNLISLGTGDEFPVFKKGKTVIEFDPVSNSETYVISIIPRWRCL